ncbi:MAG: 50S ribosomal protein L23, partial [Clostridia bacterium]
MKVYDIIKKPLMSEKSYAQIQDKVYTFIVDKNANKVEIRKAVEEIFNVQV